MTQALLIIAVVVLVVQVGLFFVIRSYKKSGRPGGIVGKYNIQTRNDAWRLLNDPGVPSEDREKIQEIYSKW